jgi:hypothetical protein
MLQFVSEVVPIKLPHRCIFSYLPSRRDYLPQNQELRERELYIDLINPREDDKNTIAVRNPQVVCDFYQAFLS